VSAPAAPTSIPVGTFDSATGKIPTPWHAVQLDTKVGAVEFRVREWDQVQALEAVSSNAMSLLTRPITIDLKATPILCWRWRVDAPLVKADMREKSGDDYAARVYLGFTAPDISMGLLERTKVFMARRTLGENVPDIALNYVWDNRHPVGAHSSSPYTNRTHMFVLRSGATEAAKWVTERRDVLEDLQAAFGTIDAKTALLAVTSDTDNTHETAHAGFADLHFVARSQPCDF
jgi:hypothetical protein